MSIYRFVRWLRESASGVTTAEYALLLAVIVVALITTLNALSGTLDDKIRDIILQIQGAGG